ncbi:MAG: hypothetical protein LDL25_01030 [Hyphomicrobiales bacterium]|jgi:truncated hemoglobin YjbI|uniref:hypothetical protein n=1 Tax=Rhabdaerophilum calidifontis TaxID=2604328 RepID=UPI00123AC2B2|nr:hypothetical protein [Rhabdaerophilum calidifontis]MCA1998349.1 hypothetical protein [Hyphomicrobiales bacterium]
MPCLPHDPSIFLEDETIPELIEEFSLRLRRDSELRPLLDRMIGNHWFAFEQDLIAFWLGILLQERPPEDGIERAFASLPQVAPAEIRAFARIFLEASLACFPLHAAAAVTELAGRIEDLLLDAFAAPEPGQRALRLERAMVEIKAGAIFR